MEDLEKKKVSVDTNM